MGDLTAQGTATGLLGSWVICKYSALLVVTGSVPHRHMHKPGD